MIRTDTKRWTQPDGSWSINRAHPMAPYAMEVLVGSSWYQQNAFNAAITKPVIGSASLLHAGLAGSFYNFQNSANGYIYFSPAAHVNDRSNWAYWVLCMPTSATLSAIMGCADVTPTAGTQDRNLSWSAASQFGGYLFDGGGKTVTDSVTRVAGTLYSVILTTDGAAFDLYVDGKKSATIAVSNQGFNGYGTPIISFGVAGAANNAGTTCSVRILAAGRFSKYATVQDAQSLTYPACWRLFAPRRRPVLWQVAAPPTGLPPLPTQVYVLP